MNILFTCAGRRTYLLKYFKEQLNGDGLIIATDMQLSAPSLSVADVVVKCPAVYSEDYIQTILNICIQYEVNIIVSLNDLELPILAANKQIFENIGVTTIVSSQEVIDICFDKFKTAQFAKSLSILTPRTYINLSDAQVAITNGDLSYPIVLKPRWGSGSIGIEFVYDDEDLWMTYKILHKKIRRTILSNASVGEDYILIQECVIGQEFGLDIMNDLNGSFVAVSVKKKLAMRAGETDKAVTIDDANLQSIGQIIGDNLHHIGNLDCDVLEKNGQYYLLELNPRFGGGFPFSYEAGVNMPKAIIEWAKGNHIDRAILQPRIGVAFSKCDYLIDISNRI